jgi:hypothetical protein
MADDPGVEIVAVDLDDGAAVATALRDCSALVYLVHAMMSAGRGYADRDRDMARTVSLAARAEACRGGASCRCRCSRRASAACGSTW